MTLEQERDRMLTKKIVVIQKCWRGYFYRRRFLQMRKAAVKMQAVIRMFTARRKYQRVSCAFGVRFAAVDPK